MGKNVFVSNSSVHPVRWRVAFPQAQIVSSIPENLPSDSIFWLHNMLPDDRPPAGVHFVVMHNEPNDEKGLEALARGASGYCNAHAAPELLQTIESVIRSNGLWVGESLLNRLLSGIGLRSHMTGRQEQHPVLQALSERERSVALCVARGESNKDIARSLNISAP
jgi:DNA-binding NarL/FixJ family response regulator